MSGIEECRLHPWADFHRLIIGSGAAEISDCVNRIQYGVQRDGMLRPLTSGAAGLAARFLLLQIGGIQHHQSGKLTAGIRGDHLSVEAAPHQKWQTAAMIQMSVSEENEIDGRRIEAEWPGVTLIGLVAALVKTAVDQYSVRAALDEVARTGHTAIGAVK